MMIVEMFWIWFDEDEHIVHAFYFLILNYKLPINKDYFEGSKSAVVAVLCFLFGFGYLVLACIVLCFFTYFVYLFFYPCSFRMY